MATREQAEAIILKLSLFYGYQLDEGIQQELYATTLEPYPVEVLNEALNRYVTNPENDRFPIPPNKIMQAIYGSPKDDDAVANEVVSRIMNALKFGSGQYYQGQMFDTLISQVKNAVGEIGWAVIEREGGWTRFAQNVQENDRTARAQLRELAKSVLLQSRQGTLGQAPKLPKPMNPQLLGQRPANAEGPKAVGALINQSLGERHHDNEEQNNSMEEPRKERR